MAKKAAVKKTIPKAPATPAQPVTLTMQLFGPGMSLLHRAGLGGLACSLKYIERAYDSGDLSDDEVPGGPWAGGQPPWTIEPSSITLRFGEPTNAGEFLRRLFSLGISLRNGAICLPGQYTTLPPLEVRAQIQNALQLTFLQHGPSCGSRTGEACHEYSVDEKPLRVEYDVFTSYRHQAWYWLERDERTSQADPETGKATMVKTGARKKHHKEFAALGPDGTIREGKFAIDISLVPGAMVRHDRFKQSAITEDFGGLICLHFAIVGTLCLSLSPVTAVLVIPEVENLQDFAFLRPLMTPRTSSECRIASASDAALQAQLRLRLSKVATMFSLPSCHAVTFRPTSWARQQKSRVDVLIVPPGDDACLRQFEVAMQELKPRVATVIRKESVGRGKNKVETQRAEHFWSDSVVRPLVADNLARGRPWYRGFVSLMTKLDPVSKKPLRLKLFFEKEGLKAMTEKIAWQDQGESAVVRAVHESLRRRFGAIASENKGKTGTMKNRMTGEFDKWRLAFAGAKTADQFRHSLCDLFARSGMNSVLREKWESVLPWLSTGRWQLTRDLALLALASYTGAGAKEIDAAVPDAAVTSADAS